MAILLQVGVKILLKNKEEKYLLLKRSSEKYKNTKGVWDIVGGRIDPGSALMDNLKREVKEETQLDFVGEAKLIAAQDIIKEDRHVVRLSYTGNIEGDPVLDEENVEFKWVSLEEMKNMPDLDYYVSELLKEGIIQ